MVRLYVGKRLWRYASSQPSCCIRSASVLPMMQTWSPGDSSVAADRPRSRSGVPLTRNSARAGTRIASATTATVGDDA
jgi:hypothetical protein